MDIHFSFCFLQSVWSTDCTGPRPLITFMVWMDCRISIWNFSRMICADERGARRLRFAATGFLNCSSQKDAFSSRLTNNTIELHRLCTLWAELESSLARTDSHYGHGRPLRTMKVARNLGLGRGGRWTDVRDSRVFSGFGCIWVWSKDH